MAMRGRRKRKQALHRGWDLGNEVANLPWQVGRALGRGVWQAGRLAMPKARSVRPGASPGIEHDQLAQMPRPEEPVHITCYDYCPDHLEQQTVDDLASFLERGRPEWARVRWINVDGLSDPHALRLLARHYELHPLAVEDVLHVQQRPKVESYGSANDAPAHLFIVVRMLRMIDHRLDSEQISVFLGRDFVLTFQQRVGDVWDPIRQRLERPESRVRRYGPDFLVYAMLDAVVDHCFPTLESYSEALEVMEERVLTTAERNLIQHIHALKRELLLLRREIWPLREVVNTLHRDETVLIQESTRIYLRDAYDHAVQVIDLVETYREIASGLTDAWMSAVSNRMNEVMKVLTIIATIFIPLSFFAGVYGMNFEHMPELSWPWAYPVWWGGCVLLVAGMVTWFKRRGWL